MFEFRHDKEEWKIRDLKSHFSTLVGDMCGAVEYVSNHPWSKYFLIWRGRQKSHLKANIIFAILQ